MKRLEADRNGTPIYKDSEIIFSTPLRPGRRGVAQKLDDDGRVIVKETDTGEVIRIYPEHTTVISHD